ncbi:MAG TPA: class I SAM-dependent methyltransferase [Anaeromyxobacteraceae bacterium]|nr:class I SAM-dependent methyltransferase [Anaeromyxobacteraceae bacterium]
MPHTATASAATAGRAGPVPVPSRCYLCGGERLALRFPARGGAVGHGAYACTSFGHRAHGPIWACDACGFLQQWPVPPEDALLAAYAGVEDPLYLAEKDNRYLTFRRALRLLGPPRGRRLLDVGAYCGFFVDVARQAGFAAEGLELSRWAAGHARGLGLTVRTETLGDRARAAARYDVITMWDVIEHMRDPRAELSAAREVLARRGRLHVATIDAASPLARLLGARWPWLMDMHLVYFDRATLPALLEETGFRVLRRGTYTHTVSAGYLLRKAAASFPPVAPAFRALGRIVPTRWPVPVNLGDNMVVTAERR